MTQQPDNLFRDKLEHFQLKPSADAWNRIEASLAKPSKKLLWLKIAAGLVLLSVASVILWNISAEQSQSNITAHQENSKNHVPDIATNDKSINTEHLLVEQSQISTSTEREKIKEAIATSIPKYTKPEKQPEEFLPDTEIVNAGLLLAQTDNTLDNTSTSVYLVLTADEVNQKYLRQQPEPEATQEEKKSSRMQMLMSVAYNLKNGEHALGDLRQMKDEIFALNFIDEKKQQSKKN